jgi:hypothetical protein
VNRSRHYHLDDQRRQREQARGLDMLVHWLHGVLGIECPQRCSEWQPTISPF